MHFFYLYLVPTAMPSPVVQLPTTTRYALGYPSYRVIGGYQILKGLDYYNLQIWGWVGGEKKPNT